MSSQRLGSNNRVPFNSLLHVSWLDSRGDLKYFQARAMDISDSGVRIELPQALANSTTVQVRSERLGLARSGSVRSCSRRGFTYLVGIEFNLDVRLKP
jgi:hypothetical protein